MPIFSDDMPLPRRYPIANPPPQYNEGNNPHSGGYTMRRVYGLITIVCLCLSGLVFNSTAQDTSLPELLPIDRNAERLTPLMQLGHGWVYDIAWSPDGARFAVSTSSGVRIYNADDLSLQTHFRGVSHPPYAPIAYSPDGRTLALGGETVQIYDTIDYSLRREIDTGGTVLSIAFSPDSRTILTSNRFGYDTVYQVALWDVETGTQETVFAERGVFSNLRFSPDGTLASGIWVGDCCFATVIWDITSGDTLFAGDIEVLADDARVGFSPDSGWLAVADQTGSLTLWDIDSQTALQTAVVDGNSRDSYPRLLTFIREGTALVTLSPSGILRIFNVPSLSLIREYQLEQWIASAQVSPDGTQLVFADDESNISLVSIETGGVIRQRENLSVQDPVVAFQPGGRLLASGGTHGDIWLWDIDTGERVATLRSHNPVLDIAFSPDGQLLASGNNGTAIVWDVSRLRWTVHSSTHTVVSAVFLTIEDGETILTLLSDNFINRWNARNGDTIPTFYDPDSATQTAYLQLETNYDLPVTAVAFDGATRTAYSSVGEVYRWRNSGDEPWQIITNDSRQRPIHSMVFFYEWLLFGGENGAVQVWDMTTNQHRGVLTRHEGWIYTIATSDEVIASAGCRDLEPNIWDMSYAACSGAELRLWNLAPPNPSIGIEIDQQTNGHTRPIRDLSFNTEGTLLASVSEDGTIIIWGVPAEE